jgi:hypothetical protein
VQLTEEKANEVEETLSKPLLQKNVLYNYITADDVQMREYHLDTSEINSTCKLTVLRIEPHVISAQKRMQIIPCYFLTGLHDVRFILL